MATVAGTPMTPVAAPPKSHGLTERAKAEDLCVETEQQGGGEGAGRAPVFGNGKAAEGEAGQEQDGGAGEQRRNEMRYAPGFP